MEVTARCSRGRTAQSFVVQQMEPPRA